MTFKCRTCKRELQPGWVICPHCGTRAPTPQELRAIADSLGSIKRKVDSKLDRSPEGLAVARRYVNAATALVTQLSKLLGVFLEHHNRMRADPSLLKNKRWKETAKVTLVALVAGAEGATDMKSPLRAQLTPMPDGCFDVEFYLIKVRQHTDGLVRHYADFIERSRPEDLNAAGTAINQLNETIKRSLDEIEKLVGEIAAPG